MDYASFEDYWAPLQSGQGPVGTFAVGLAEPLKSQIKGAVRAACLAGRPDGPRSLTAMARAVRGVRP